ncbi:hypothetical protein U9M48_016540 [Paspalum notatum var. saurae]|uniref:BRCT domain-containing protein n=1 Tax=Paspalum notatum var. saurae TaxID=547442 RepID=A0AAQ3T5M4_PASNO
MSLVAYDASSDEEDAGEPPAAAAPAPSPTPVVSSVGPQPRPPSLSTAVGPAPQPTPPAAAPTQSVAPASSSNVSLLTPSLDLPDVADLFSCPADNASRKRESNGSALHDSRSKFPRTQSQPRGGRSATGNSLIPPQLRGRSNVVTEDMSKLAASEGEEQQRRGFGFRSTLLPRRLLRNPRFPLPLAASSLFRSPIPHIGRRISNPLRSPNPQAGCSLALFDQWRISAEAKTRGPAKFPTEVLLAYVCQQLQLGHDEYPKSSGKEPGDASLATAIDIVESLLVESDVETSQKISTEPISGTKSASILGAKVAQCLAKRAEYSSPLQKAGIFNWADAPDDNECPTIMISRKKQRVHANTRTKKLASQNVSSTSAGSVSECIGGDSGLNAFKKPEPVGCTDDLYEAYDIGPSTQMAAEAMEALSNASTDNYVARDNALPEGSILRTNLGKECKADNICSVESSLEKQIGGSSSSVKKHPSKSKNRKNPKRMAVKAKGSMNSGTIHVSTDHELSERIKVSGATDSNVLGSDAVIHPGKKRTYTFISRSSKVQFRKTGSSTTVRSKSAEGPDSSTAKAVGLTDHDLNQLVGVEKQPISTLEDHNSSLTSRAPLSELNTNGSQSRTQVSKKPLKRNLLKSPGSRELASLFRNEVSPILQSSRQRRNMSKVRVLLSQSMDKETIKMQTKVLIYFGLPVVTSISEATHFVAEKFARTRNMLEAIAMGIPIVTPSWLECCGEARCFIDEKKYIMRDMKKEKELGFSMPVSLGRARKMPLLAGRRVLITPNTKPSKELLKSLVVAAHGQTVERITTSMKNTKFERAFVISCEQDHSVCKPLIKSGLEVFDSELLLNGIVTQRLDTCIIPWDKLVQDPTHTGSY